MNLIERLEGLVDEARAVGKAAVTYLIGLTDPHDEDIIEIIDCNHPEGDPVPDDAGVPGARVQSQLVGLAADARTPGRGRLPPVHPVQLREIGDPPEEIGGAFARRVHEVKLRLDTDRVHVVGHSLSGVVARYWAVVLDGADEIGHVVTLGSPLNGTPWSVLPFLPRGLSELEPGSELVAILNGGDDDRSKWTTVAGDQDLLVPPDLADLDGSNHVVFEGAGHVGLLYDERVLDEIAQRLVAADTP